MVRGSARSAYPGICERVAIMSFARSKFSTTLSVTLAFALVACGGGGAPPPTGGGTPTPTPTPSACSLSQRQQFVKAAVDEWYLFPELVDNTDRKSVV